MTICAAMLSESACWIGSDTLWVRGDRLKGTDARKVRRSPQGFTYGISGSASVVDMVTKVIGDATSLSVSKFRTGLRKAFIEDGWEGEKGEGYDRPIWNAVVLITDGRTLYEVQVDLGITAYSTGKFVAIGCGAQVAYGAAFVMRGDSGNSATRDSVKTAIEASIEYSFGCGGNIDLFEVVPATAILSP